MTRMVNASRVFFVLAAVAFGLEVFGVHGRFVAWVPLGLFLLALGLAV